MNFIKRIALCSILTTSLIYKPTQAGPITTFLNLPLFGLLLTQSWNLAIDIHTHFNAIAPCVRSISTSSQIKALGEANAHCILLFVDIAAEAIVLPLTVYQGVRLYRLLAQAQELPIATNQPEDKKEIPMLAKAK